MDKLEKEVPLEQALADCRAMLAKMEPILNGWSDLIASYHPKDPLGRLATLYLERWEKLREWVNRGAGEDYAGLFQEITELGNFMPELASTRVPFSDTNVQEVAEVHKSAGFSDDEVDAIMDDTNRPERGQPRIRRTDAIAATRMQMRNKSYHEIADALCKCGQNHGRQLRGSPFKGYVREMSKCADRYRDLIGQLEAVLEKYSH